MELNNAVVGNAGEGHVTIFPANYQSIVQGSFTFGNTAAVPDYAYFYNSTHDDGDEVTYNAYLASGTYTIRVTMQKADDKGKVDVINNTDGVTLISQNDNYNAAIAVHYMETSFTITNPSIKNFSLKVNGKNAASSNHFMGIVMISIWRTA